jgi:hypothetical protein
MTKPLYDAVVWCNRGDKESGQKLLEAGYEPFAVDNDGTIYYRKPAS